MTQQFAGKSALVTGGGSGIGRASALALAAEGALVTVAGRTAETLKETVRLIEASGGSARYVVADMADESQRSRRPSSPRPRTPAAWTSPSTTLDTTVSTNSRRTTRPSCSTT
jgi:NAD(P)-dependent dehydrogenase (short-subunit alcohol dehydrogenase family)